MFIEINEALNWLYSQKKQKKREDLSRIKRCLKLLDLNPSYPIIHLAGTNGKGSTATFTKSILTEANYKVGFFVSPFVICFNERIQINNNYITNQEILNYLNKLKIFAEEYYKEYSDTIPFFELTLLMALLHFKKNKVDVGVIECGLGGRLDATNALNTTISLITNIGFDHMATLGNTLEEIAYHKLGITRENQLCFTTVDEKLHNYFKDYAEKNNIDLRFINNRVSNIIVKEETQFKFDNISFHTKMLGDFQAYNASLAIACVKAFVPKLKDDIIQKGLDNAFWPGRLEKISNSPIIILDGAHNIHGIKALVNTISKQYPNKYIKTVFTALADKAYPDMLKELDKITNFYYFTTINDLRATTSDSFTIHTNKDNIYGDYNYIFLKAISELKEDEVLLITGSLHFISEARKTCLNLIKEVKYA